MPGAAVALPKARRTTAKSGPREVSSWKIAGAAAMGFIAGAVCWHFVGFWDFMTEAVFYARPDQSKGIQRQSKIQSRQPGSTAAAPALLNCSLVRRVAAGGDAHPSECDGHIYKFQPPRNIVRADRGDFGPTPVPTIISGSEAPSAGWSARVETLETGSIPPKRN